uniref:Latent membrane protein 1 n=1 Tax=Zeugodacus cucurbitae TaxID=28588 RepID=A0A0A1WSA4_ZEUCU
MTKLPKYKYYFTTRRKQAKIMKYFTAFLCLTLFHLTVTKTTSWALISNQHQHQQHGQQQRQKHYYDDNFPYDQQRSEQWKTTDSNNRRARCIDCRDTEK